MITLPTLDRFRANWGVHRHEHIRRVFFVAFVWFAVVTVPISLYV